MKNIPQKADTFASIKERFNIYWITRAISVSERCGPERYYYDALYNELFSVINLHDYPLTTMVLDKFGMRYAYKSECDIIVRLELVNDVDASIIELPHLTIENKLEIQKQFLSMLSFGFHQHNYLKAIAYQTASQGFILDTLLYMDNRSAWLIPYWEYLKSQIALTYLEQFTRFKGIHINLAC